MNGSELREARLKILEKLGGSREAIEQVVRYCENPFDSAKAPPPPIFPMPEEPHVEAWRGYLRPEPSDFFACLQQRLPQLLFPIEEGISAKDAYRDVIRRGKPVAESLMQKTLSLERPDAFRFFVGEHPSGALPVLVTPHRRDFETLDRALGFRNEPVPINPSVNAHTIAGFINWDRVRRHQTLWIATRGSGGAASWVEEMDRVLKQESWRFYDRFILLCAKPYSGVSSAALGLDLDEGAWVERSTLLRLEHEFTHYATKRVYGTMNTNLLDEVICDWAGITKALGRFRADWFLKFLGLENWPEIREGARALAYLPGLGGDAVALLCRLTTEVAAGVEELNDEFYLEEERPRFLLALTRLTLELLASDERERYFLEAYDEAGRMLGQ
jgi:hypothetical protein